MASPTVYKWTDPSAPVFIRAVDPDGIYNTIISENVTPLEVAVEIV